MNGTVPYLFFFSYSRADWESDKYLAKFFEDLEREVAVVKGAGNRRVGFRDEQGVKTGDDWNRLISAAVQVSDVLVCVYTSNFFNKDRTHEFCAKEFMAFLKRNPEHRYERVLDQGRERYEVRDARNILPVLWLSEADLVELNKLPPYAVRTIQYTLNFARVPANLNKLYREKGMSLLTTNRKGTYREIVRHLARRIIELSANPLPSLVPPPDVRTLPNAFWDSPEPNGRGGAGGAGGPGGTGAGGPNAGGTSGGGGAPDPAADRAQAGGAAAVPIPTGPEQPAQRANAADDALPNVLGPRQLVAFEVRNGAKDTAAWAPYPEQPSLRVLVEEIAQARRLACRYLKLDLGSGDFAATAWSALSDATEKRARPILIVDPQALAPPEWRNSVASLVHREWRGGIVFPVAAADQASAGLVQTIRAAFEMTRDEREWVVVRIAQGGVAEFRTAIISVADEILARIVKHGAVTREAPATSGSSLPRIANTLDAWVAP